jgi:hypothetical protein
MSKTPEIDIENGGCPSPRRGAERLGSIDDKLMY